MPDAPAARPEPGPLFPGSPVLVCHDPLAEALGAGDGRLRYTFDDVVRVSGHACPTVAGAFLMVKRAFEELYGDATVQRGDLRVTVYGPPDQGVNGPISQVFTLLTGAAAGNGFHGLAGHHVRQGLLRFVADDGARPARFTFERLSTGHSVTVCYDPAPVVARTPFRSGAQGIVAVLTGNADPQDLPGYGAAWRAGVEALLADGGRQTVTVVS